jgi:nicotinamidase-related amidase
MREGFFPLLTVSIFVSLLITPNPLLAESAAEIRKGSTAAEVKLSQDLKETALIIIDMNRVDASGEVGVVPMFKKQGIDTSYYMDRIDHCVIPHIQSLLSAFRKRNAMVIYTILGSDHPELQDVPEASRAQMKLLNSFPGTKGFEIRDEIKPKKEELLLTKPGSNAFTHTGLNRILQLNGIKTVIIVGVLTPYCVGSTAYNAWDLGYQTIVVNDATATFSREQHENYLKAVGFLAFRVMDTDEIVSEIEKEGH